MTARPFPAKDKKVEKCRVLPMCRAADAIVHLSPRLEYRQFHINDRMAVINPDADRIGKRITDVAPIDFAERMVKGIYTATKERRIVSVGYETEHHIRGEVTILVPDTDTVLLYANKVSR